jgi:general secretion pathway protein J
MGPHTLRLRGSLPPGEAVSPSGAPALDRAPPCAASRLPPRGTAPAARRSRFHDAPRRGICGFTLIELLVALAVMSMLAILSWRSIDGMNRTQTLTQQRADELLRLQAALGQWNADLDAVVNTDELNPLEFDGKLLRMTRRDSGESSLSSPGVRVVAWSRLNRADAPGAQWMRWQSAPVQRRDELAEAWQRAAEWGESGAADGRDSAVALAGIDQWQLFYHRGETWGNSLSSVGNESAGVLTVSEGSIPNGVRLVLTLTPGQGLAGTLVRDWVRPTLQAGRT